MIDPGGTTQINVYVPHEMEDRVIALAKKFKTTRSRIVRDALEAYLMEDEVATELAQAAAAESEQVNETI